MGSYRENITLVRGLSPVAHQKSIWAIYSIDLIDDIRVVETSTSKTRSDDNYVMNSRSQRLQYLYTQLLTYWRSRVFLQIFTRKTNSIPWPTLALWAWSINTPFSSQSSSSYLFSSSSTSSSSSSSGNDSSSSNSSSNSRGSSSSTTGENCWIPVMRNRTPSIRFMGKIIPRSGPSLLLRLARFLSWGDGKDAACWLRWCLTCSDDRHPSFHKTDDTSMPRFQPLQSVLPRRCR